MKKSICSLAALAATLALVAPAWADVVIRVPFVRVQVGDGVYVRAPFVNLFVPSGPRVIMVPQAEQPPPPRQLPQQPEIIPEPLGYEEADLGALPVPKVARRKAGGVYLEATHGSMLAHGAAGRSPLRDRALTQPAVSTPIKVNPAPVTLADKSTLAVAAGASTFTSVWRASQAREAVSDVAVGSVHVVELAELAA